MNLQLVVENMSTLFTGRKCVPFYILVFNVSVENVSVKMCLSKILHITEYTLGKIFQRLNKFPEVMKILQIWSHWQLVRFELTISG